MGPTSVLKPEDFSDETLPENSLAAIKHALDLGADGFELDVHITKDNKIAVVHDNALNKKVYGADREGNDLGNVSDHTLEELKKYNIGNGHTIPSLKEVLDFVVVENEKRAKQHKLPLIMNIELKGDNVVDQTFSEISEYLKAGKLRIEDFVFNSFNWDKLCELRQYSEDFKVVPAIRTTDLFGEENVVMPGFKVAKDAKYADQALRGLQELHNEIGCFAFDCIVFDLRPEFVEFCKKNQIGLFTSTSSENMKAENVKPNLALMLDAADDLPMVCFRADNTSDTLNVLHEISRDKGLGPSTPTVTRKSSRQLEAQF